VQHLAANAYKTLTKLNQKKGTVFSTRPSLLKQIPSTVDCPERTHKIDLINNAISRLEKNLSILRVKQSAETTFRAHANWYEHGEKSNKYFLNLNKRYNTIHSQWQKN
jgi:hypothetical protein